MNQDIDLLDDELTVIASSFPSELGGGLQGHAGLVNSDADYAIFTPGTPFIVPANPGVYPLGVIPAAQQGQKEAEHKALVETQFQMCIGASKRLKDLILQAVDEDFLLELRDEGIAYLNVTLLQMITHLHDRWGTMDHGLHQHYVTFGRVHHTMECCGGTYKILQPNGKSSKTISAC
jgi:hypothetical protein